MRLIIIQQARPGMRLAQDIFVKGTEDAAYLRKGEVLSRENIGRLNDFGVERLIIEAPPKYHSGKLEPVNKALLPPLLQNTKKPVQRVAPVVGSSMKTGVIESLQSTFDVLSKESLNPESAKYIIRDTAKYSDMIVNAISGNKTALVSIDDIKQYDDYTYHHSLAVCLLSLAVAQHMNFKHEDLKKIGLCALLHDIGKTAMPQALIKKPEKLTDSEFEQIKQHPEEGAKKLIFSGINDPDIVGAVLCHHEKYDGSGYPHGLAKQDIPLWARIIAAADVYDALTSERPYRSPMQPSDALEYIMGGIDTFFDYDVVSALIYRIDVYPIGHCVELSDGRLAVVLENANKLRPKVEILQTGKVLDLFNDSAALSLVVKRHVPDSELRNIKSLE